MHALHVSILCAEVQRRVPILRNRAADGRAHGGTHCMSSTRCSNTLPAPMPPRASHK
jgi:hypothetical protein